MSSTENFFQKKIPTPQNFRKTDFEKIMIWLFEVQMEGLGPQNDIGFQNVEGSKRSENGSKNLKPGNTSKLVPIL